MESARQSRNESNHSTPVRWTRVGTANASGMCITHEIDARDQPIWRPGDQAFANVECLVDLQRGNAGLADRPPARNCRTKCERRVRQPRHRHLAAATSQFDPQSARFNAESFRGLTAEECEQELVHVPSQLHIIYSWLEEHVTIIAATRTDKRFEDQPMRVELLLAVRFAGTRFLSAPLRSGLTASFLGGGHWQGTTDVNDDARRWPRCTTVTCAPARAATCASSNDT